MNHALKQPKNKALLVVINSHAILPWTYGHMTIWSALQLVMEFHSHVTVISYIFFYIWAKNAQMNGCT